MEESQSAVRSSSASGSKLNSSSNPEGTGNGKQKESTTKSISSKPTQRASSPNLHTPSSQRKASSPHSSQRSLRRPSSRSPARSPARSTHSTSTSHPHEKDKTPGGVKQQAEGTHKLVEYADEDGISHWHHARQEHVNLHTECGRHGDEWLFGGWSLMGVVRGLLGRR